MLGAIVGDVIGSIFEGTPAKDERFPLFSDICRITDDSVLTIAVADAILSAENGADPDYRSSLRKWGSRYPQAGYGGNFHRWLSNPSTGPYNSWGNGSAMRVSAVGWAFNDVQEVLRQAELSALPTHNHPEGVKGAQAVALSVYLARKGASKDRIREEVGRRFGYNLNRNVGEVRKTYHFEISCQKSVPEAILAFLDSQDFEDAIRKAISLGGDADTQAAIAGAVAEAFYGPVPAKFRAFVLPRLPEDLLDTTIRFAGSFMAAESTTPLDEEIRYRRSVPFEARRDPHRAYFVLIHSDTRARMQTLAAEYSREPEAAGARFRETALTILRGNDPVRYVLDVLLATKSPCMFAESAVAGDGTDWNHAELGILGDIGIAVPVCVFDDGRHHRPSIHDTPFNATLLFVPGALLVNGLGKTPADYSVVRDGKIDIHLYVELYERRLLPSLVYASTMARRNRRKAFITVPGLGCGQFAGTFKSVLPALLRDTLAEILTRHRKSLSGIRAVRYDPYRGCPPERRSIGGIDFLVRPLMDDPRPMPQLCRPGDYGEEEDDFSDCELFSIVAWDPVSWPGNDFFHGIRTTDDGVKAAATDSMYRLTGVRGQYNKNTFMYEPPEGYRDWSDVVRESRMTLNAGECPIIVASGSGGNHD